MQFTVSSGHQDLTSVESVNLTPSLNEVGVTPSVWTSLVISMDMSAGDFTPRSTWKYNTFLRYRKFWVNKLASEAKSEGFSSSPKKKRRRVFVGKQTQGNVEIKSSECNLKLMSDVFVIQNVMQQSMTKTTIGTKYTYCWCRHWFDQWGIVSPNICNSLSHLKTGYPIWSTDI